MDGRTDGWMDAWMDGWVDGEVNSGVDDRRQSVEALCQGALAPREDPCRARTSVGPTTRDDPRRASTSVGASVRVDSRAGAVRVVDLDEGGGSPSAEEEDGPRRRIERELGARSPASTAS